MTRLVIGIDPGITGGIAFMRENGTLDAAHDLPTEIARGGKSRISASLLAALLKPQLGRQIIAVVEQVGAMPKQGVTSMFNFGRSLGVIEGVLAGLQIPIHYVTPQRWKAHSNMIGTEKGFERTVATQLWPEHCKTFQRVKDSGRADAALIARYGYSAKVWL